MKPLADIAERRQEHAAEAYRDIRQELSRYQRRLDEVLAYRQEYLDRFTRSGEGGVSAQQMKDYQVFLGKLDVAVEQLRELVRETNVKCAARKDDWVARRARYRALDEVVSKYRQQEFREELRAGEREADEIAQRRHQPGGSGP